MIRRARAILMLAGLVSLWGCFGLGSKTVPTPDDAVAPAADSGDPLSTARARCVLEPGEPFWPYREGMLLAGKDSTAAAEAAYRRSLAIDPGFAPALSALSGLLYGERRHDEAIALLEAARDRGSALPATVLEDLALQYDAAGRVDDARALLDSIPATGPVSSVPSYVLLDADDTPEATAAAGAAAAGQPKNAVHKNNLGVARIRAGNPLGARDALLEATTLDPSLPGPYYNLALIESRFFMDDDAARGWFDRYWKLAHDDPDSLRRDLRPDSPAPVRGTAQ